MSGCHASTWRYLLKLNLKKKVLCFFLVDYFNSSILRCYSSIFSFYCHSLFHAKTTTNTISSVFLSFSLITTHLLNHPHFLLLRTKLPSILFSKDPLNVGSIDFQRPEPILPHSAAKPSLLNYKTTLPFGTNDLVIPLYPYQNKFYLLVTSLVPLIKITFVVHVNSLKATRTHFHSPLHVLNNHWNSFIVTSRVLPWLSPLQVQDTSYSLQMIFPTSLGYTGYNLKIKLFLSLLNTKT